MRYSLVQAASLAFVGLSTVFTGLNAAPTAATEVQDVSLLWCSLLSYTNMGLYSALSPTKMANWLFEPRRFPT